MFKTIQLPIDAKAGEWVVENENGRVTILTDEQYNVIQNLFNKYMEEQEATKKQEQENYVCTRCKNERTDIVKQTEKVLEEKVPTINKEETIQENKTPPVVQVDLHEIGGRPVVNKVTVPDKSKTVPAFAPFTGKNARLGFQVNPKEERQKKIMKLLKSLDKGISIAEISTLTGIERTMVGQIMKDLLAIGHVNKENGERTPNFKGGKPATVWSARKIIAKTPDKPEPFNPALSVSAIALADKAASNLENDFNKQESLHQEIIKTLSTLGPTLFKDILVIFDKETEVDVRTAIRQLGNRKFIALDNQDRWTVLERGLEQIK